MIFAMAAHLEDHGRQVWSQAFILWEFGTAFKSLYCTIKLHASDLQGFTLFAL